MLLLSSCATIPAAQTSAPPAIAVPKTYQWLHGSGEAALLSRQTFAAMADHAVGTVERRRGGAAIQSAVLADGATPQTPRWADCGAKPAAVVLDVDETALLNTGSNYDTSLRGDPPFDPDRWSHWERDGAALVEAMPGVVPALDRMRGAGITIVFNSNRENRFATQAAAALAGAGLGEARPGETLFLRGDVAPGSGKDPRRAAIAARYCVVAMAGDQMGDFADAYNEPELAPRDRRRLVETAAASAMVGRGWFLLANPAYGPGVRGSVDEIFPADKRWPGPGGAP